MTESWRYRAWLRRMAAASLLSVASVDGGTLLAAPRLEVARATSGGAHSLAPVTQRPPPTATVGDPEPCVCDPRVCDPMAGQPDPNGYRHEGFFLRLTVGPGYMYGTGEPSAVLDGMAGGLGVAVGANVTENLALHLDMQAANAFRSNLAIDGAIDETYNVVFQRASIGPAFTYYVMPYNLYASAALGAGALYTTAYTRLDDRFVLSGHESTRLGPAVSVSAGKEWWVTPSWGIGASLVYNFLSVNGDDLDRFTVSQIHEFGLRLSATYN